MNLITAHYGRNAILAFTAILLTACGGGGGSDGPPGSVSLSASVISDTQIRLTWSEPSGNVSYSPYIIARADSSNARIGSTSSRSFVVAGLAPGTRYCFEIRAPLTGLRVSNVACATTQGTSVTDSANPSTPQQVSANYSNALGTDSITVSWLPSVDDSGIASYTVFRDGISLGGTTGTSFTDTSIQANTTYCFTVIATDIVGKTSGPSDETCTITSWEKRALDISGIVNARIALDANDVPHVAYKQRSFNSEFGMEELTLGLGRINDTFETETLNSDVIVDELPSDFPLGMVLDANDNAHMLHQPVPGPSSPNLQYIVRSTSQTDYQDLQEPGGSLPNVSLTIDVGGQLHACVEAGGALYYGNTGSGVWIFTPVDSLVAGTQGSHCSIAVEANGAVHIAFLETTTRDLWYASNASGAWSSERIDQQSGAATSAVYHTAIATDSAGFAHIAYAHDVAENDMEYATNASGAWSTEKVDDAGTVGQASDIVIDGTGRIYVLYEELADTRSLRLATREGAAWGSVVLSSSGLEPNLAIAVDSTDALHLVFNNEHGELSYMTNRPQ